MDRSMDDQDLRDPRLDSLLRPALLVEPPPAVQQTILAAVLRAAAAPVAIPFVTGGHRRPDLTAVAAPVRSVSPLAYMLLGAVLLTYVGLLPWLQSVMGGVDWVGTMVRQLLVAADLVAGSSLTGEPLALAGLLVQVAPWLLLLPLAWFLWDSDRASAGAR